ncbi:hypothetical protein SAMN04487911_10986 [Arenibacter nanhaiticus]|uniref:Uncharacterized protein n=1 Tax=Arenibacter nanhaiticus TaxID=558155 RepID=A0A1M6FU73_9FLAO|nr:hypothetical protein [Arenibacter nanhaiticus]SHJ01258.1 hypothetical protein SAMN04487911_10986 [Arenibacter nanhaiticus]
MIKNEKNNDWEEEFENAKNLYAQGKSVIPIEKSASSKNVPAQSSDSVYSQELDPNIKEQMRALLEGYKNEKKADLQFKADRNIIPLTGLPIPPVIAHSPKDKDRVKSIYAIYETGEFCNVAVLKQLEGWLKEEKNESICCLIKEIISKFYSDEDLLVKEVCYLNNSSNI